MNKDLNLSGMLDFSEVDLTAPDKVIEEILAQLPEVTQNIVSGSIVKYDGHVTSYTTTRTSLAEVVGTITMEKQIDIQDSLGKCGEENKKFECFLYTSGYTKYKYLMFFMKYGISKTISLQRQIFQVICTSPRPTRILSISASTTVSLSSMSILSQSFIYPLMVSMFRFPYISADI